MKQVNVESRFYVTRKNIFTSFLSTQSRPTQDRTKRISQGDCPGMESQKLVLGTVDYIIFSIAMLISVSIGLYFRFVGGQQKTNEEYLLAGRNMTIFPVAVSLMATFLSAATLMGAPAETYTYGTNIAFFTLGHGLAPIIAAYVFIPVYFETGVSTAYEYLEIRFGKTTRRILSAVFLLQSLFYSSIILYGPALALNAVSNIPTWIATVSIGAICTFYSSLSGIKAVMWADVFQSALMFICALTVIIKGSMDLGGVANVLSIANEGGRLVKPSLSLDMETRNTTLNSTLQSMILCLCSYGCSQLQVQRLLTLKDIKRSKMATFLSIPFLISFDLLCYFAGLVLYAYFQSCDPMTSPAKPIQSADQMIPYYVASTLGEYPGLPALCMCGIFSASLSTISSSINSMAAVTWRDIIQPLWPNLKHPVTITKFLSLFFGLLCIALSFFIAILGSVFKSAVIVIGMVFGPTLGIFLLAVFFRTANEEGAILGIVSSFIFSACLSFIPRTYQKLPVSNECPALSTAFYINNSTARIPLGEFADYLQNVTSTHNTTDDSSVTESHFRLSYMWVSSFSLAVCLIVGYTGSLVVGYYRGNFTRVSPEYLSPVRRWFLARNCKKERPKRLWRGEEKEMAVDPTGNENVKYEFIPYSADSSRRTSLDNSLFFPLKTVRTNT